MVKNKIFNPYEVAISAFGEISLIGGTVFLSFSILQEAGKLFTVNKFVGALLVLVGVLCRIISKNLDRI
jgi:uncharacterized membrane protein YdcZ (DUF606 family)